MIRDGTQKTFLLGSEYKSLDKILDLLYNYVTFLNRKMTVTTEDGGRQNMYAKEPQVEVMDEDYATQAELAKRRWAKVGWVAANRPKLTTGQIIPGIF